MLLQNFEIQIRLILSVSVYKISKVTNDNKIGLRPKRRMYICIGKFDADTDFIPYMFTYVYYALSKIWVKDFGENIAYVPRNVDTFIVFLKVFFKVLA